MRVFLWGSSALLWFALMIGPLGTPAAAAPARADTTVHVSFEPAAFVRLRGQRFVSLSGADMDAVNDAVARWSVRPVERAFAASEGAIDATRRRLLAAGRRDVPDLNRHYRIATSDAAARDALLDALRRLPAVDAAIPAPEPAPPPVTPSFTSTQRYGNPAPVGMNAAALAARPDGLGQAVKIIDVEYSWNQAHEDLAQTASALIPNGSPSDPYGDTNHGTAVAGVLVATANAFGVTGLAAGSGIGLVNTFSSTTGYRPADAIDIARQQLEPGDVILVEQQTTGVAGSGTIAGDFVPSEWEGSVYDAVRLATQSGISVVEAGGNGGVNLDGSAYQQPFPQGQVDSGAIIVGAGSGDSTCTATTPNSRLSFSTYGSRVNLQGWGRCVSTTGYGSSFDGGPNALYTQTFNGTSSASATVAAAVALYSSVVEAETGAAPSPLNVRNRLVATGTPQGNGAAGSIGPLPDLLAAGAGAAPTAVLDGVAAGATNDTTPTFTFTSGVADATFECRRAGDPVFSTCTSPYTFAPPLPSDAASSFEVRAIDPQFRTGPPVKRTFVVDTVPPAVALGEPAPAVTNDTTPTFSFTSDDPGATFSCRVGPAAVPGTFAPCSSPHTTDPLPDGSLVFEVRASDVAGNTGAAASRALSVDTAAPVVSIDSGPPAETEASTSTFTFSASEPGVSFACRVVGAGGTGDFATCSSPHTTPALPPGTFVFEVRATDGATNTGPAASRGFTVSEPAPSTPQSFAPAPTSPAPTSPAPTSPAPLAPATSLGQVLGVSVQSSDLAPTIGPGRRASARVARDGSVRLPAPRITCPRYAPACTLTVTVRRRGAGGSKIASSATKIAPGKTATVGFRLTKAARAVLARSGRLEGTVVLAARHGATVKRRTVRVTLRR